MPSISYSGGVNFIEPDNRMVTNRDTMPVDGWITDMTFYLCAENSGETADGKLILYVGTALRFTSSVFSQGYNSGIPVAKTASNINVRVDAGQELLWGMIGKGAGTDSNWKHPEDDASNGNSVLYKDNGSFTPATVTGTWGLRVDDSARGTLVYAENVAPSTGTWRYGTTPTGPINTTTPTFQGNMPHGADAAYDETSSVQLQIVNTSDPSIIYYDTAFTPTSTENTQGYFSRAPVTLPSNTQCQARFRHADTFGDWSAWSTYTIFTTAAGPSSATSLAPNAKINAIAAYNYVSTPQHPNGTNVNTIQIRLHNATGAVLYTSQELGITSTAPGTAVTVSETLLTGHPDLQWATHYGWSVRYKDTIGIWGSYSGIQSFWTNSAPQAPTNLDPAGGIGRNDRLFSATVNDPDGDPITSATIEIINASTGAMVTGYPAAMTVTGNTLTYTAPASGTGSLVLGTAYRWRARASDGQPNSPGAYSEYADFSFVAGPTVTMLGPLPGRQNIIRQPSAEYDPTPLTVLWSETARDASNFIDRTPDLNAYAGAYVWQATTAAVGDNRFQSDYITVDATKPYVFFVRARGISGTSAAHFNVLCYNASNTLLGTLYPGTGTTGETPANAANVPAAWTRYGGIVWPIAGSAPAFPAGTTKVRVQLTPSRSSAAVVQFDAFSANQLPAIPLAALWTAARDWYGYADGDTPEIGSGVDLYTWTSTPGDSISNIAPVLTNTATGTPAAAFSFDYASAGALAKTDDKFTIERWDDARQQWVAHYSTNYATNGTRETIPVPQQVLENETRYRVRVWAKDSAAGEGSSPWIEFDTAFTLVPELVITQATADASAGRFFIAWQDPGLTPSEFAGVELQRETKGLEEWEHPEPAEIVEVVTNPGITSAYYHFPRSRIDYYIRVRVVKNIGVEQVASRWKTIVMNVDYWPYSFLKDTDDPLAYYAAYDTEATNRQAIETEVPTASFLPWGADGYSHDVGLARLRSGAVSAEFYDDPQFEQSAEQRYEITRRLVGRRRPICIMDQVPDPEKVFVMISGTDARNWRPGGEDGLKAITFPWQETRYTEDYYKRNGLE